MREPGGLESSRAVLFCRVPHAHLYPFWPSVSALGKGQGFDELQPFSGEGSCRSGGPEMEGWSLFSTAGLASGLGESSPPLIDLGAEMQGPPAYCSSPGAKVP